MASPTQTESVVTFGFFDALPTKEVLQGTFITVLGGTILIWAWGHIIFLSIAGLACVVVGYSSFWTVYKQLRPWLFYGPSRLEMERSPVPMGTSLRARLRAPISTDEQPPNGFQVRVAATQRRGDDKDTVWEDRTHAHGQPRGDETSVPLSLDLPAQPLSDHRWQQAKDKPWGSAQGTLEKLTWTLVTTASFDDTDSRIGQPDYEASFDLPVSVPDDIEERVADASSAAGSISSSESVEPSDEAAPTDSSDEDEVYWDVDDDGETAGLRRADADPDASDDAEEAFTEPVSEGIRMRGSKRLIFSFDRGRPSAKLFRGRHMMLGTFFGAIVAFCLYGVLVKGITGLILVAAFFAWPAYSRLHKAWRSFTHTSRIQVANGEVEVQKGPFFRDSPPTRMSCEEVVGTTIKAKGGAGSRSLYTLSLKKRGADSPILVAEGLPDKDEAEWMADQIHQAVEQQTVSA
jgi:hypothetical protein